LASNGFTYLKEQDNCQLESRQGCGRLFGILSTVTVIQQRRAFVGVAVVHSRGSEMSSHGTGQLNNNAFPEMGHWDTSEPK